MKNVLVVLLFVLAGIPVFPQQSAQPSPSYDDTVRYLQDRLDGGLEERAHCSFIYHKGHTLGGDPIHEFFDAKNLSPHVSWPIRADQNILGKITCEGRKPCVKLSWAGRVYMQPTWEFSVKERVDVHEAQKALLHLLDLCGVGPLSPKLF